MAFYFLPLGRRGVTHAQITDGGLNRKVFKTGVFVNKAGKPVSAHYRARTDNPSPVAIISDLLFLPRRVGLRLLAGALTGNQLRALLGAK